MDCYLAPGPAPEHPARRVFAGKRRTPPDCPLSPKGLGSGHQELVLWKAVLWKALQAWLGSEYEAELL